MSYAIQSAALSTGVTLPYVEQGDPAGVPIVLLHGYSDSWRSWERLLPELPDALHAFAITQRGHGDADKPADGYHPSDLANDTVAFMEAVGIQAAIIAGHSGGSYTAQQFAIDHPDRTLGLVLIGALRTFQDNAATEELWDVVSELADPIDPEFVRAFQESTTTRPVPAEFLDAVIGESRKLPARVWKAALRGLLDAVPPTTTGRIAAPSLILWGEGDQFAPHGDQDALAAAIDDVRTVVYEATGHAPHWERPEQVAADLAAFGASVAAQTPSRCNGPAD
jgi:pimeloyl-ACP methyl ester carboxylesterase